MPPAELPRITTSLVELAPNVSSSHWTTRSNASAPMLKVPDGIVVIFELGL